MEIEDTFSEVFSTKCGRFLITAANERWARIAAQASVGFATSIIFCDAEAGIDTFVESGPDGRPGYSVMITNPSAKKLKDQLLERIGQCVLTAPTTACFNLIESEEPFPIGKMMNCFGDGYGTAVERWGRKLYSIPIMGGEFLIEENFGYTKGYSGNLWVMVNDVEKGLTSCERVIEGIEGTEGIIAPFPGGICASGSKVGSCTYTFLKASTNHTCCPTLSCNIDDSTVPEGVVAIYEFIFNAVDLDTLTKGFKSAVDVLTNAEGIERLSAGNYGGKLGPEKIFLREL
ncbi:MAG: formylmethanofuran--tetrahydromethanopterin N-formyltransferase [Candidatus Undinarchaeales archaeon]|jgi:formylmethanofuran--tetrahydromethanopterin N-formyltransferase|nr:formylmethanofuran--tetrahydromethanopterin N-formyltransferase [Candidatus Undinarchaeales archaeon]MDP7492148.1 formylmethanofuran--tetrahydromethanopterin N-formyltransferase [Candidatus Undinarchaeales archaeon]